MDYDVKFGLCCICMALKEKGVSYKNVSYSTFKSLKEKLGVEKLCGAWLHNVEVLDKILRFCAENKIENYRISSNIFPLATHPNLEGFFRSSPIFAQICGRLEDIGNFAKKNGLGLSFHPSQFIVIGSENPEVRKASAAEINFNSFLLDCLFTPKNIEAPINVHMNTRFRESLKSDFEDGLSRLDKNAKARLTFENEDRGYWSASRLLNFLKDYKIAVTLDFLHHKCNNFGESDVDIFNACAKTWGKFKPVFHYAESRNSLEPRFHSDYCKNLPPYFGMPYICQIEAKQKDRAILKLKQKINKQST